MSQAQFEGIPLSEIERKELYFSKNAPDMTEVHTDFERSYDPYVYEQKIAALIRTARRRDVELTRENEALWEEALQALSDVDDHLMKIATQSVSLARPHYSMFKVISSAVLAIALLVLIVLVFRRS